MKRDNSFDAVKTMRKIRDKMSKEIKGMSAKEQIEYIEKKSGFRREEKNSTQLGSNLQNTVNKGAWEEPLD